VRAVKVMTFMTMPLDLGIISDLLPKQVIRKHDVCCDV
jgi:hypothetical protein